MTASIPAGWYPDPAPAQPGQDMLRWWDGSVWTQHRRPAQPSTASAGSGPSSAGSSSAGSPSAGSSGADPGYVAGSEYGGQVQFGSAPAPPEEEVAAQAQNQPQQQSQSQQYGQQQGGSPGQQHQQQQFQPQQNQPQQNPRQYGQQQYGRSPYTEPQMAVSQRRKLIELTNEYDIYGTDGAVIGKVVEVGQSGLKKAARFLSSLDQFMTHTLEVRDAAGQHLMTLTRPAKIMKSTLQVLHPNGAEIGRLVQRNMFGRIKFGMEAGGQEVGSLNAQNWIAWNFQLQDANGTEIGRITKTFEGFLTTMFTSADQYAVELDPNLAEPLKSLSIAAALCVDTALKQDNRGWN